MCGVRVCVCVCMYYVCVCVCVCVCVSLKNNGNDAGLEYVWKFHESYRATEISDFPDDCYKSSAQSFRLDAVRSVSLYHQLTTCSGRHIFDSHEQPFHSTKSNDQC